MKFSDEQLEAIFDRASGKCHLCHGRLAYSNYASFGRRGAWEVEHSKPRALGGTNRLSNLFPTHISCNRSKGSDSTRAARSRNGVRRAPLSTEARGAERLKNGISGAVLGAFLGGAALGPPGALLGGFIGSSVGHRQDPDNG